MSRRDVVVTVSELQDLRTAGRGVRLLDVRWRLGGPPGLGEYRAGHLPGAVYVDLDEDLAGPAGPGSGRHPLPEPAALQRAARSWGLRQTDTVVAYDDNGNLSAARAWWLLRWAGLVDVLLLDGGLAAWRAAGLPLVEGDELVEPGDVTLSSTGVAATPTLDADGAVGLVASGGVLLDARTAQRYRGEVNAVDPVPGHIPGAVSAPTMDNTTSDGVFRPAGELADRFAALGVIPGARVGVYCGSGITATHEIAALAIAGVDEVALYPGSWSQRATLAGRPVATGDAPG